MRGARLSHINGLLSNREKLENYLDATNPIALPENRKRRGKVRYIR